MTKKTHAIPCPHKTLKAYRGILKGRGKEVSLDEIRHIAKTFVGKRFGENKKNKGVDRHHFDGVLPDGRRTP